MCRSLLGGWLCCLPILFTVACTIPPESGSSAPRPAHVLPADARALAYGRTAGEVIQNSELRDKVRALFGADWTPASQGGGQLALGAGAYFEKGGPLRMVQIAGSDYIALTGCVPRACQTLRVLLLIREGGSQIFARLDDGGFSHYYAYGNGGNLAAAAPPIVDSGLRALEKVGDPYPPAGS